MGAESGRGYTSFATFVIAYGWTGIDVLIAEAVTRQRGLQYTVLYYLEAARI